MQDFNQYSVPDHLPYQFAWATWPVASSLVHTLREEVFIQEQGVPESMEWDVEDHDALHMIVYDGSLVIATARLLPTQISGYASLGRVAVGKTYRRQGIAKHMLERIIALSQARSDKGLELHAQLEAIGLYSHFGFLNVSDIFEEAGILHQMMRLTFPLPT